MSVQYDDEDDVRENEAADAAKAPKDFDCPSCNANNPRDERLTDGEEIICNYCGSEYKVKVSDGKIRFREL